MKRVLSIVLALVISVSLLSVFSVSASTAVSVINTKSDFLSITQSGSYKLGADIDLGELADGSVLTEFSGTLDGDGHTVSYSVSGAFVKAGLFAKLSGSVKNLKADVDIDIASVDGERNLYVGGIAATMTGSGEIFNCNVQGQMNIASKTTLYAGGLVGNTTDSISNSASVKDSVNSCNITVLNPDSFVSSEFRIGGIAATGSEFESCMNNAILTASCTNVQIVYVGGICATESSETEIKYSVNNNSISASAAENVYAGGIAATLGRFSNCMIQLCHNNGDVSAYLKGYVDNSDGNNSNMSDAFAAAGGIMAQAANKNTYTPGYQYATGESQSIIRDCSNSGGISASCDASLTNKTYAAGICAQNYGFIYRSFDRHSGELSAKVTGPVFAALNENGTLRGGVYDCYYAKRDEQYNIAVGVYDDTYYSFTEVEDLASISSFPKLDFTKKWQLNAQTGYPEVMGLASLGDVGTHKHDYVIPKYNDADHWLECECTAIKETTAHSFDYVCDETCGGCAYTRSVTHDHQPTFDSVNHYKECTVCHDKIEVAAHTFDNACDTSCDCGHTRTVSGHKYDNACDKDCNICGDIRTPAAHAYDNACDKDCNICGALTTPVEHVYDNACDTACNVCNEIRKTEHKYDNACDKNCNICNAERTVAGHKYDNDCDTACNICNATRKTEHKYDNAFDSFCNICKAERTAPNTPTKYFIDVPEKAWYKYYVDYAVAYGLFSGTSENTFSPNADMTRAQFVQVLANIAGAKLDNNVSTGFSDAPSGKWFTGAVKWAVENGVASGVGNGKFNPTGKIDRQQMCVMLVNYIERFEKKTLKEKVNYTAFADDKEIAGWAKTAVVKCFKAGLVSGTGNNKFSPKVVANRATGATIFTNFYKEYIA